MKHYSWEGPGNEKSIKIQGTAEWPGRPHEGQLGRPAAQPCGKYTRHSEAASHSLSFLIEPILPFLSQPSCCQSNDLEAHCSPWRRPSLLNGKAPFSPWHPHLLWETRGLATRLPHSCTGFLQPGSSSARGLLTPTWGPLEAPPRRLCHFGHPTAPATDGPSCLLYSELLSSLHSPSFLPLGWAWV